MLAFLAGSDTHRVLLTQFNSPPPLVFVIAGEASGDNLGAKLMAALRDATSDHVQFAGIGGPAMTAQGLNSLFPMRDLSLMGMAEIVPHLPRLIRRLRATTEAIEQIQPAVIVTVDSPGFSFRVAKRVRPLGIPLIHYVAPQLWAWRPGRGHELTSIIDHMLALLPFEPDFFKSYDVPCTFVGHPVIEAGLENGNAQRFRQRHGLGETSPIIAVLPGSRHTEVRRLLPVFGRALHLLSERHHGLTAAIPVIGSVAETVRPEVAQWQIPVILITDIAEKIDAFASSAAAITKSGTVTLELAIAGVPMVVSYKVNPLTAALVGRLLKIDDVALVNLLAGKRVVPELLQGHCTPEAIAGAVSDLLTDQAKREAAREGMREAVGRLGERTPSPSVRAAEVVLSAIEAGNKETASVV